MLQLSQQQFTVFIKSILLFDNPWTSMLIFRFVSDFSQKIGDLHIFISQYDELDNVRIGTTDMC